ncbi:hypothetical protein BJY04DRAFT_194726 [Aspergillus karnatakaensis]|uniref:uncharacterized protein n=1 Tax=Aspergillus karnatakaensis TaxID=1810916 RepID=UPI003CCC980E
MYDLLYRGTSYNLIGTSPNFYHAYRWIHIPANNPLWMETVLIKWAIEDRRVDGKDLRNISNLLNRSHRGQYPHSRFNQPTCQSFGRYAWVCMPYLHFETVERHDRMEAAIGGSVRSVGSKLSSDQLLLQAYPALSNTGIHIWRTLDQFFYPNLDTSYRDRDQVVLRRQREMTQAGEDGPEHKIYMVDQLWILVLDNNLVVTSFPQRWDQPENDRFDILSGVLDNIKRTPIENAVDLISLITERCCGTFDRHAPLDNEYQFLAIYEYSIGSTADREANLSRELFEASAQASMWLKHQRVSAITLPLARASKNRNQGMDDDKWADNPRFLDMFLDYSPETRLLFEIKDIRDEISIIHTILDYQAAMTPEIEAWGKKYWEGKARAVEYREKKPWMASIRFREHRRIIETCLKDLERMDRQAAHIYESVVNLLDLKQKHANPFEARLAREQAAGTARQGKTIMIFTIVTIIFLPLSFITSFFTVNIAEFPEVAGSSSMPLSFVSKYIFGVGFAIAIPLILLAFAAQDFKLGLRAISSIFDVKKTPAPKPLPVPKAIPAPTPTAGLLNRKSTLVSPGLPLPATQSDRRVRSRILFTPSLRRTGSSNRSVDECR